MGVILQYIYKQLFSKNQAVLSKSVELETREKTAILMRPARKEQTRYGWEGCLSSSRRRQPGSAFLGSLISNTKVECFNWFFHPGISYFIISRTGAGRKGGRPWGRVYGPLIPSLKTPFAGTAKGVYVLIWGILRRIQRMTL